MKREKKIKIWRTSKRATVLISLGLSILLLLMGFVYAGFGYTKIEESPTTTIDTSTTNHFNGSNINISTTTCSGTDKVSAINNATGVVTCSADVTGAGVSYDLNITGNTGSGVIIDSEVFNITGNGSALVRTYISGNDLVIEATDTTGSGGNTTEQMQDAVGAGFTGNLTYDDAGNLFDVNASNILTWLNGFYRRLVVLITGSDIAENSINTTHIINSAIRDDDLNLTNITLVDFTNDAGFTTTTYVDNQNTSQTNYINSNNVSINNWANSKFYFNVSNLTQSRTDGKLCVFNSTTWLFNCSYTDLTGSGGNTTEEMQDAIGIAFGNGLLYDDVSNWFNLTDFSSVVNTTNVPNSFIQNITFNSFGDVLSVVSGSVDFSAFTPLTTLNNGSYLNVAETDPLAYNGTLVSVNILNNGSYFNVAGSGDITSVNTTLDFFLYNGSDSGDVFLRFNDTRLNLSTYALLSVLNNGTYIINPVLNNGSYFNTPHTLVNNRTCTGTDKFSAYDNITGNFVCSTDAGASGGNTTEEVQDAVGNSVGSGLEYNDTANWLNHSDTSAQASSDNSGNTFVQDIILDTFGHITSLVTAVVDVWTSVTTGFDQEEQLNTTGNPKFTNLNLSGNLTYYGEILPDNQTCSANQILKKAGFQDWDCAEDNATNSSYLLISNWNATNASYLTGVSDVWVNETGEDWNTSRFIMPSLNNTYTLGNSSRRYSTIFAVALDFFTQITTSQIADSAITAIKLATESVTAIKIASGAVNTTHILDFTIKDVDVGFAQINASHLNNSAINTTHILNNTILSADLNADVNSSLDTRYLNTGGDLSSTGNYTFNTSLLHVDSTRTRVGIGTANPNSLLNVVGNTNITTGNLSIDSGRFVCLNEGCTQWIKANSTGVFIQG